MSDLKDLIIVGAGGLGREALALALKIQNSDENITWRIKGFIDDNPGDFYEKNTHGYDVIGTIKDHVVSENNVYVFAIADIGVKKRITTEFLEKGAEFINLISPFASVSDTADIGLGNIIQYGVTISTDVTIGNFNLINSYTTIGHDAKIRDYATISPGCAISGYCEVGDGVFLGSHVVLCPHSKVGEYARVGAQSVVIKRVKEGTFVMGNPAKRVNI